MRNPSFGVDLEEGNREFVEAYLLACDYPDSRPPQEAPNEKPAATTESTVQPTLDEFTWPFQINPSALRHSLGAQYADSQTWAAVTPDSQFFTGQAEILEIQGAIFDVWHDGKSLTSVLEKLKSMIKPAPSLGKFHPPILTFVWGSQIFGPCILTAVSWDEVAWIGGEPATVQVNLSLKRIPDAELQQDNSPLAVPPNTDSTEVVNTDDQTQPAFSLTENQRRQASDLARAYLTLNRENLSPEIQQVLRSKSYLLYTNPTTGDVSMLSPDGTLIGRIFRWNGSTGDADSRFTTQGITNLPTAAGRTLQDFDITTLEPVAQQIRAGTFTH